MGDKNIKSASLAEVRAMKDQGKIAAPGSATEIDLPNGFWSAAKVVEPRGKKSVHLRLDADVFDFFSSQGKGHISRMQAVLRSYMNAQKGS